MEVHFTPDVEKKLHDLAAQSGRGTDELLQDALGKGETHRQRGGLCPPEGENRKRSAIARHDGGDRIQRIVGTCLKRSFSVP